ncbi:MAG: hypothetical protein BroJett014_04590 [Planctomycetota bacterium]|nr:MAG: hypothetical protein BroJett014_04590 [Planctomycetota bacterium]
MDVVTLQSGLKLTLDELYQCLAHSGRYEGSPPPYTQRMLAKVSFWSEKLWPGVPHTFVGPAPQDTSPQEILCVGRFTAANPVKDPQAGGSNLVIGWCQTKLFDGFAAETAKLVDEVRWERLAVDFDY